MSEEVKELKDIIESACFEPREHSGRFMYGVTCLGFTIDGETQVLGVFAEMLENALDNDESELIRRAMRDARTDDMGTGTIIYFPSFEYSEHPDS